jgi:hypothetical protein
VASSFGRPLHRGRSFEIHKRKRVAKRKQKARSDFNGMERNGLRVQRGFDDAKEDSAGRVQQDT